MTHQTVCNSAFTRLNTWGGGAVDDIGAVQEVHQKNPSEAFQGYFSGAGGRGALPRTQTTDSRRRHTSTYTPVMPQL